MSMENETVVVATAPGDGCGGRASVGGVPSLPRPCHLHASKKDMIHPPPKMMDPVAMAPLLASVGLPEAGSGGGMVGVGGLTGKPLQPKNGLPTTVGGVIGGGGPQKLGNLSRGGGGGGGGGGLGGFGAPQKLGNKRRYSMNLSALRPPAGGGGNDGNSGSNGNNNASGGGVPISKRRRRASESHSHNPASVLPSHFHLGGNIFDPLNLNSLLDEEVSQALNARTPESSPLPAKNREPLEILVPKDITDPLNLNGRGGGGRGGNGGQDGGVLVSPLKRRRHRNRHHQAIGMGTGVGVGGSEHGQQGEGDKGKSTTAGGGGGGLASAVGDGVVVQRRPSAVPEEVRRGAVAVAALLCLNKMPQDSPQPYELNTSINCRDEVVPPILPRRHSQCQSQSTGNSGSGPQSGADGGQAPSSSRSRKRRRTVSRSDRSSITPTPSAFGPGSDRGGSVARSTFQTPIVAGAKGLLLGRDARSLSSSQASKKTRKATKRKYQYGNYSHYYGYRRPGRMMEDPRLAVLKPEWFRRKKVLDLGCNTGHITLAIARYWDPAHILGVDIDGGLVRAARQNLRHYLSEVQPATGSLYHQDHPQHHRTGSNSNKMADKKQPKREVTEESVAALKNAEDKEKRERSVGDKNENKDGKAADGGGVFAALMDLQLAATAPSFVRRPFLLSFRLCRGPITAPLVPEASPARGFPHNVFFMKENYVLERQEQVAGQQEQQREEEEEEYDVILCLGMTLWVQLNWGDAGLQRLFRRAHRQLRQGGIFILEPQPWSSYARRKRISETTYRNYCSIRLKPDHFTTYLTSEVGFSSYELLGTPCSTSRGFQRPIYLFHKGPASSRK
ncbi:7SK snRNA methylphosphate capping enzyme-like [Engraulis encrasicolus]|uniref:7SK snRNA methylphosphate capping enzyme-like n=1 Tax=Engraulis encrasicolus TaxID=184585 RepID=UPI002FD78ECD